MTRKPTDHKLEVYDKIFITPDSASWDPYNEYLVANEAAMIDYGGNLIDPDDWHPSIETPFVDSYF